MYFNNNNNNNNIIITIITLLIEIEEQIPTIEIILEIIIII